MTPQDVKLVFVSIAMLLLPLLLWVLRPRQCHPVSPRWFVGGQSDLLYRLVFTEQGLPRRWAWLGVLLWHAVFLLVVWLIPAA